jgi:hypothetical protein
MRRAVALLGTLALLFTLIPAAAVAAPSPTGTWIVQLRAGLDPAAVAPAVARQHGGAIGRIYRHAINGFSFRGSQAAASALLRSPLVAAVEPDAEVWLDTTQTSATWGLARPFEWKFTRADLHALLERLAERSPVLPEAA